MESSESEDAEEDDGQDNEDSDPIPSIVSLKRVGETSEPLSIPSAGLGEGYHLLDALLLSLNKPQLLEKDWHSRLRFESIMLLRSRVP